MSEPTGGLIRGGEQPSTYLVDVFVVWGMVAITLKRNIRYWMRLFGYFLAVLVVGGGVTGSGVALLFTVPGIRPGGAAPTIGPELLVGVSLVALGGLSILAGLCMIVLNVVADGIRLGFEAGRNTSETPFDLPADQSATGNTSHEELNEGAVGSRGDDPKPQRGESDDTPPDAGRPTPAQGRSGPEEDSNRSTASAAHPSGDDTGRSDEWKQEIEDSLAEERAKSSARNQEPDRQQTESISDESGGAGDDAQVEKRPEETSNRSEQTDSSEWVHPDSDGTGRSGIEEREGQTDESGDPLAPDSDWTANPKTETSSEDTQER